MKRVTVLDGMADDRYADFEAGFLQAAERRRDTLRVDFHRLRDMEIRYCTGCWTCWVRTPGICTFQDDMRPILQSMLASDLCVFLSPVSMGFVTSLIKKACDRMIPIVLPDFAVCHGEFHHRARYAAYPKLGLILVDPDKDAQTLDIVLGVFRRTALNLKTDLTLNGSWGTTPEEAADAVSHL
ncbi:MAG: flavodoxin family protein [Clostridia bacterium]|nr:flavodoxin family protein [Clostridia bacterium]